MCPEGPGGPAALRPACLQAVRRPHRRPALPCPRPARSPRGLVGNTLSCDSGQWERTDAGVGAGVDSFYEYLLKVGGRAGGWGGKHAAAHARPPPAAPVAGGADPARAAAPLACLLPSKRPAPPLLPARPPLPAPPQAYLAFGDRGYLEMFRTVYAAAMSHLQLDQSWNGHVWCVGPLWGRSWETRGAAPPACWGLGRGGAGRAPVWPVPPNCDGPAWLAAPHGRGPLTLSPLHHTSNHHMPPHLPSALPCPGCRLVDVQMDTGQVLHPYVWSLGAFWPGLQALAGAPRRLAGLRCMGGPCRALPPRPCPRSGAPAPSLTAPPRPGPTSAPPCRPGGRGAGAACQLDRRVAQVWLAARNV